MGLQQNMISEKVRRLPLREPVLCEAGQSIRTAVEQMRERKLGCMIVVDNDRKPIGMFTESMLTKLLSQNSSVLDDPVDQYMATHWPWVKESDPIVDVLDAMQVKNVRFICVVDEEGRVSALAGQKSLIEYIADHFPGQVMVQRVGCAPYLNREGA